MTSDIQNIEVSKTVVSATSKGVYVPIVCIPAGEYYAIMKVIARVHNHLNVFDADKYRTAAEVNVFVKNQREYLYDAYQDMNAVLQRPYNEDAEKEINIKSVAEKNSSKSKGR